MVGPADPRDYTPVEEPEPVRLGIEMMGMSHDAVHALDWRVEGEGPEVAVWVGGRCVAAFDVDDDLPEDQRRVLADHLRGALCVGLEL